MRVAQHRQSVDGKAGTGGGESPLNILERLNAFGNGGGELSLSSSMRLLMGGEGILDLDLDLRFACASSVLSHDICSSGMADLDFLLVNVSSTCGGGGGKLLKLGKDVGGGGGKSITGVGNGGANVGGGA